VISPLVRLRTLSTLGGLLRGEAAPTGLGRVDDAVRLADELLVAPALYRVLKTQELRVLHRGNAARNLRLRDELTRAVLALNAAGIEPVLLKGGLQLVDGSLDTVGDRWLTDLDLLVEEEAVKTGSATLCGLGYAPVPNTAFGDPHAIPFVAAGAAGPIDLHVEVGSGVLSEVLPVAEVWAQSSELGFSDARARAPAPTHQVLHNILHSAVQDKSHAVGALPLRQLVALAELSRVHGDAVEWQQIAGRMERGGLRAEYRGYVWLAHRYAGMRLPAGNFGLQPRLHELRVLAAFAARWPVHVEYNLRFAFGRDHLDVLYDHRGRPLRLAWARARHLARTLRQDRRRAFASARKRGI
jgi:hypothetical protein